MRISKSFILKLAVSIILLCLFLFKVNVSEVFSALSKISIATIISIILLDASSNLISAYKWNLLIPQHSYLQVLLVGMLGRFYSLVLPGQLLGEAVKAYQLGAGRKNAEQIAASVMIDKIGGVIGVLVVGIVGLLFTNKNVPLLFLESLILTLVLTILFLYCLRFDYFKRLLNNFLQWVVKAIPKMDSIAKRFMLLLEALNVYVKNPSLILSNVLLGCIYQLMGVSIILVLSINLNIPINFIDFCWVFAVVAIALLLPVTIAGLGVREGAFIGILGWLGVSSEKALELSFSFLAIQTLDAIIGGIIEVTKVYKKI